MPTLGRRWLGAAGRWVAVRRRRVLLHCLVLVVFGTAAFLLSGRLQRAEPLDPLLTAFLEGGQEVSILAPLPEERGGEALSLYVSAPLVVRTADSAVLSLLQSGGAGENPARMESQEQAFFTYIVREGDTMEGLAERFQLKKETLVWNNAELKDPEVFGPEMEIVLPAVDGIIHIVKAEESLEFIANLYSVDIEKILAFEPNGLSSPQGVTPGRVLVVPGGQPPKPQPPPTSGAGGSTPQPSSGFIWPVRGCGISRGVSAYHDGLDIAGFCNPREPVVAAASGVVVHAGWDGGWGLSVVIRHDNGYYTRYAHLSAVKVSTGQFVNQGQVIGTVGSTGNSRGDHLHFEIRSGSAYGAVLNPLNFL